MTSQNTAKKLSTLVVALIGCMSVVDIGNQASASQIVMAKSAMLRKAESSDELCNALNGCMETAELANSRVKTILNKILSGDIEIARRVSKNKFFSTALDMLTSIVSEMKTINRDDLSPDHIIFINKILNEILELRYTVSEILNQVRQITIVTGVSKGKLTEEDLIAIRSNAEELATANS